MRYSLEKFKREHLEEILSEPSNVNLREFYTENIIKIIESQEAYTITRDGIPLMCGGATQYWEGRGQMWVVMSQYAKEHQFIGVARQIRKYLEITKFRRLELSTRVSEFDRRRAEVLGFTLECPLAKKYLENGEDCMLFARVK